MYPSDSQNQWTRDTCPKDNGAMPLDVNRTVELAHVASAPAPGDRTLVQNIL